jgi:hypothetical protein
MEELMQNEAKAGNCQANFADQCFAVRPETRARDFVVMARLRNLFPEPQGNRVRKCDLVIAIRPETRGSILGQDEVLLPEDGGLNRY